MGLTPVLTMWRTAARRAQLLWWTWAASEIDPLHPDVPIVVRRLAQIRSMR